MWSPAPQSEPEGEAEHLPLRSQLTDPRGRELQGFLGRRVLLGLVPLAALLLAVSLLPRSAQPVSARVEAEEQLQERAEQFAQCNGNGIVKPCQKGCLCTFKNDFFSFCKPITAGGNCNEQAAQALLKSAQEKAAPLEEKAKSTAEEKNKTQKAYDVACDTLEKATKTAQDAADERDSTAKAATMESVRHDHMKQVKEAQAKTKGAEDAREARIAEAKEKARADVREAGERVKRAEEALARSKLDAKSEVETRITAAKQQVKEAEAALDKISTRDLQPILDKRKKECPTADAKAEEATKAVREAMRKRRHALEEKTSAAREAAEAADRLASTLVEVKRWEKALV